MDGLPAPQFRGRERERAALDLMLDRIRKGESAALVMRGEAGIGKTALMQYCARQASGCNVAQIAGVESELELPFAAIHQLCEPILAGIDTLPEPQQQALRVAFGLSSGTAPDRFVVSLAVLGLLAEAATDRPFVCLIDDAQWLDAPSRLALGFVARRLLAEPLLLLLAVRETGDAELFPALPSMTLDGLPEHDARALVTSAVSGHLDEQVRDRIVSETAGNPLWLLELPREMSPAELAGGFWAPRTDDSFGPNDDHYTRRIRKLPKPTQQLLLLAAADPTGDTRLLWRAAQSVGIPRSAAAVAESEQLLAVGSRVRFRHPLVRSAAYAAGTVDDRRAAHSALAAVTDAEIDPERRVWHLAAAATGPDEAVASQLERAAVAVQARAGLASAAVFLARSVELTGEAGPRAERALAAASAHMHAGAFEAARAMLAEAEAAATGDEHRGRIDRLKGEVQFVFRPGIEASVLLVRAAKALEPLDARLSRETYVHAWLASFVAGPLAPPGGHLLDVSAAARAAPPAGGDARPWDLLLDGLATMVIDGRAAGAPGLRKAVDAYLHDDISDNDFAQWGDMGTAGASFLWDWHSWDVLSTRQIEVARASGALAPLAVALHERGLLASYCGDFVTATSLLAEYNAVTEATGAGWYSTGDLVHRAYQGRPGALELTVAGAAHSLESGAWYGAQLAIWARAVLCNGLGRYADALAAAKQAAYEMVTPGVTGWALPELIEAAVRSHQPELARSGMELLEKEILSDSDWAAGIEARCRALVSDGEEAEHCYADAIELLARTPLRTELARAHLLYGEWLRRDGRRIDAREQLDSAYEMFSMMGAEGFAERARRELLATGEKVRKRNFATRNDLTPQEEHIARRASDGRSNAEIGAELFLSVRTIEWHLRKVFTKLGIASRRELKDVLPSPVSTQLLNT